MKYKFCPYCKRDLVKKPWGYRCKSCNQSIYSQNYPSVGVVPIKENKILLGKRSKDPGKGTWDVIGGFIDKGEHPKDAATRETKEETNLKVEILDLLDIYMDKYSYKGVTYDVMVIYYIVRPKGKPKPADDVAELKWFDIDNLPEERFAFDHLKTGLSDVKRWMEDNAL